MLVIRLLYAENRNLSLYALTTVQISVQVIFLNIKSKIINVLKNGKLFTLLGIEESLSNYEVKSGNEKKNTDVSLYKLLKIICMEKTH